MGGVTSSPLLSPGGARAKYGSGVKRDAFSQARTHARAIVAQQTAA
jgi:hypothetical protein